MLRPRSRAGRLLWVRSNCSFSAMSFFLSCWLGIMGTACLHPILSLREWGSRRGLGPAQDEAQPSGGSRPTEARRRRRRGYSRKRRPALAGTVGDGMSAAFTAERRRRRPCRRSSGTRGLLTARLSKRSRAARSLASARLCGPGRRERTRPKPQADQRERVSPTRRAAPSASDCRDRAAVEASPAACRAQRRAGARSAGADVTQRSAAKWRHDGDGAGVQGAASGRATAPATPPPGPTALYRTGAVSTAEGGSRGHDSRPGLAWPVPLGR